MKTEKNKSILATKRTELLIFGSSIFISSYWLLSSFFNVYSFVVLGAVYELLWLPILVATFSLPILSLISWIKQGFNKRSLHIYSILIASLTIIYVMAFA